MSSSSSRRSPSSIAPRTARACSPSVPTARSRAPRAPNARGVERPARRPAPLRRSAFTRRELFTRPVASNAAPRAVDARRPSVIPGPATGARNRHHAPTVSPRHSVVDARAIVAGNVDDVEAEPERGCVADRDGLDEERPSAVAVSLGRGHDASDDVELPRRGRAEDRVEAAPRASPCEPLGGAPTAARPRRRRNATTSRGRRLTTCRGDHGGARGERRGARASDALRRIAAPTMSAAATGTIGAGPGSKALSRRRGGGTGTHSSRGRVGWRDGSRRVRAESGQPSVARSRSASARANVFRNSSSLMRRRNSARARSVSLGGASRACSSGTAPARRRIERRIEIVRGFALAALGQKTRQQRVQRAPSRHRPSASSQARTRVGPHGSRIRDGRPARPAATTAHASSTGAGQRGQRLRGRGPIAACRSRRSPRGRRPAGCRAAASRRSPRTRAARRPPVSPEASTRRRSTART